MSANTFTKWSCEMLLLIYDSLNHCIIQISHFTLRFHDLLRCNISQLGLEFLQLNGLHSGTITILKRNMVLCSAKKDVKSSFVQLMVGLLRGPRSTVFTKFINSIMFVIYCNSCLFPAFLQCRSLAVKSRWSNIKSAVQ